MSGFNPQLSGFPFVYYTYFLKKTIELWNMYNTIADGTGVVVPGSYADGTLKSWEGIQKQLTAETLARPAKWDEAMALADRPSMGLPAYYGDGTVKTSEEIVVRRSQEAFASSKGNLVNIVV